LGLTYKEAGVDISAGNQAVNRIKKEVATTFTPEVLTELGGFGALFAPDLSNYREPVLVSGTDGVGTKLKIAFMLEKHGTVGIDLVAMCVNDILAQGARPLFFLDYLATGILDPERVFELVKGISNGCKEAGCALIGGETAEMPGFYRKGEYDLAGFAVGIVDKNKIITGEGIKPGDAVIGLVSSGIHSNGYSLVRKVFFEKTGYKLSNQPEGLKKTLGEVLIEPTRIYVKPVLKLLEKCQPGGIAHITGGGLLENIPRILPENTGVVIRRNSWPQQEIFNLIQRSGNIEEDEMYRTFNMGIGMILIVSKQEVAAVRSEFNKAGEETYIIGEVLSGKRMVKLI
jgi:phosphoribosylformylglycinamidine cyclo-ligase